MAPLAIKVIPRNKLHVSEPHPRLFGNEANEPNDPNWTHSNWLKSRFHFSFAEYNNPRNSHFGVIRVMNDHIVQPHRGFGTHPHRNIEIVTYIVEGEYIHEDSSGTEESLGRGSVQFLTAGTGIMHSESNNGDKPLRFIQTWIDNSARDHRPNYGSFKASDCKKNTMQHIVSNVTDRSTSTPVEIQQDIDMWACELEERQTIFHEIQPGRQGYLLCIEGTLSVFDKALRKYDACEITGGPGTIEIKATHTEATENGDLAHFILFTTKGEPAPGRSDLSQTKPRDRRLWV